MGDTEDEIRRSCRGADCLDRLSGQLGLVSAVVRPVSVGVSSVQDTSPKRAANLNLFVCVTLKVMGYKADRGCLGFTPAVSVFLPVDVLGAGREVCTYIQNGWSHGGGWCQTQHPGR